MILYSVFIHSTNGNRKRRAYSGIFREKSPWDGGHYSSRVYRISYVDGLCISSLRGATRRGNLLSILPDMRIK